MSGSIIRKNNIGRALVRFLIGAVIIAALVIVIKEFWLKKGDAPTEDVTAQTLPSPEVTDVTQLADVPEFVATPAPGTDSSEQNDFSDDGFIDDNGEGVFGENEPEPVVTSTPEPTATPEPTPTPAPAATAVPASMYANRVTSKTILSYKWHLDKESRINHNITEIKVLPSVNGGSVLSIVGWSYATYTTGSRGWDGNHNTTYVDVTNEKGQAQLYEVTTVAGITGVSHTTDKGKNMEKADFTVVIDVSEYPDGTYTLGSRNVFYIKDSRYSHGYTFGSTYSFTVVDGIVTEIGGVENN